LYLDDVTIDIDTWPNIPTYVEFEGPSETHIKQLAIKLGFDWNDVTLEDAATIIQRYYDIPVLSYSWFTFDKIE
jgi:adenylate cyclase class 2